MARPIRIQHPGAAYHGMGCGNHGQEVFGDDQPRKVFLEAVEEACQKTGWCIHACVLMANHYYLLRESHSGQAKVAHGEAAAGKALQQALEVLGLSESEAKVLPKGAPEKVALAWWLRQRTTVPWRWANGQLAIGHFTRVSQAIGLLKRRAGRKPERIMRHLNQVARQSIPP